MKYLTFFVMLTFFLASCTPTHKDATAVCNCYNELHKISADEEVKMQMVFDSCAKLHSEVITRLKSDPEEYNKYIEAYTYLQNH